MLSLFSVRVCLWRGTVSSWIFFFQKDKKGKTSNYIHTFISRSRANLVTLNLRSAIHHLAPCMYVLPKVFPSLSPTGIVYTGFIDILNAGSREKTMKAFSVSTFGLLDCCSHCIHKSKHWWDILWGLGREWAIFSLRVGHILMKVATVLYNTTTHQKIQNDTLQFLKKIFFSRLQCCRKKFCLFFPLWRYQES